jgi:hypothetical protein
MADPERSIPLATVIWFGSLEFMSLGYGYDMVLLPPRHPTDEDLELSQLGGALPALGRREPPDDDEPGATTVFASRRVMGFPGPAPLSRTPAQISSLKVWVG